MGMAPTATEVSPRARPALNGAAGVPDMGVAATAFTGAGLRYRQFGVGATLGIPDFT
jgi:hypothetical protein